jgi:hypothetical protein
MLAIFKDGAYVVLNMLWPIGHHALETPQAPLANGLPMDKSLIANGLPMDNCDH